MKQVDPSYTLYPGAISMRQRTLKQQLKKSGTYIYHDATRIMLPILTIKQIEFFKG